MSGDSRITDLKNDLGDEQGAFDNEELERLLMRSRDSNGNERHYVALAMGVFQLLTQAARFADYTINEAQERRAEIWANLEGTYRLLLERPDVNSALGSNSGEGAGITTRGMKFTRTRDFAANEYAFPNNPFI